MTPKSPHFRAVADELIGEVSLTLKRSSVEKYQTTYDAFRLSIGNLFLEDITRDDIKRFKEKMLSEGKVPHTVNAHLGKLNALFEFAIKNRYIEVAPVVQTVSRVC